MRVVRKVRTEDVGSPFTTGTGGHSTTYIINGGKQASFEAIISQTCLKAVIKCCVRQVSSKSVENFFTKNQSHFIESS